MIVGLMQILAWFIFCWQVLFTIQEESRFVIFLDGPRPAFQLSPLSAMSSWSGMKPKNHKVIAIAVV